MGICPRPAEAAPAVVAWQDEQRNSTAISQIPGVLESTERAFDRLGQRLSGSRSTRSRARGSDSEAKLTRFDGGIYRDADVVKAVILDADIVSVGRLHIYGPAAADAMPPAYDAVDRLSSTTDAAGRVTTYADDAISRRTETFNPAIQGGTLVALGYTPDGLLAS
ncbi:MAG: alpha-hydroxy-acid oxidizing protein [Trebonia sp.]